MQKSGHNGMMLQSAWAALALAAVTFLLPLLVFGGQGISPRQAAEPVLPPAPSPAEPSSSVPPPAQPAPAGGGEEDRARTVKVLLEDGQILETNMADYLWGVVAAEMPASFEPEALKAQAAAARTYTLWKALHNKAHPEANVCTDYTCCQAWLSREAALEKWGGESAAYAEKLDKALAETDGTVLYFDAQPIQAAFHASSAGRTQDAVAVWGSTVPYLASVATPEGDEAPNYHTTVTLPEAEVRAALESLGCKLEEDEKPEEWLSELTCSESGAVLTAQVGDVVLRGNVLRTALGLRSPSFTVECSEGVFTFSVTGYGHGVGLSQYGANALAKEGKTWREILAWYYTGVEFGDYDGPPIPEEQASPQPSGGG